ncbi:Neuropeptide Y receptor type 1 [Toxocara canis]|uniref:Neuropeptide Y receptor type 1 n=1 Tax=Toxocara canis TaxID=6265 RepID=A0A0B2VSX4_TOXCA|nr:Neuropeptide Y receptor type 1 [Toxocara canis]
MSPNNECDIYSQLYPDPASSPMAIVSFAILYSLIFLMGIIGNSLLIFVTLRHRTLQTVQNIFILNLAASDIIMCLLSVPVTPVTNIYKNWFFGAILCRLIPCVQGVSVFISTFSLGAIAFDRYLLVVRPHAQPLSRRGAVIVTAALWTLSIVVTIPYALFMTIELYPGVCGEFCTEHWPNDSSRRAYTMVVLVSQFVIPFIVMAFCYASIFARFRVRARRRLQRLSQRCSIVLDQTTVQSHLNANGFDIASTRGSDICAIQENVRQRLLKQTRRTTVILVSMVLIFGCTWLPHNLISLVIEYDGTDRFFHIFGSEQTNLSYLINLFTHSMAMTNNVANPILYAWLNPTFHELVMQTCCNKYKPVQHRKISKVDANNPLKSSVIVASGFIGKSSQRSSCEPLSFPRLEAATRLHMIHRSEYDGENTAFAGESSETQQPLSLTYRYRPRSSQRVNKNVESSVENVLVAPANITVMSFTSGMLQLDESHQNAALHTVHNTDIDL